MNFKFEKVEQSHLNIIFSWLDQDVIKEFWDNTQAHKDDIINFVGGRKFPSSYADGKYVYWIASLNNEPFAMIMTIHETHKDDINQEKIVRLSRTGNTYGLDYMIGNPEFFGKGYGATTLIQFMDYFRAFVDPKADTFLIDPANDNPRAKHVYMKAGFDYICDFKMEGNVSGKDKIHHLLIKKFDPKISLVPGKVEDYPVIQNMARFYVYDVSRTCGHISSDWAMPENGLFESSDFKSYFEDPSRKAYLVKVYDELAGFILLNQVTYDPKNTWNMGQFFIIAKFQGLGIASYAARKIWEINPGLWEVSVIPENQAALSFWDKTISKYTAGVFEKSTKMVNYDQHQPKRINFTFDSHQNKKQPVELKVTVRPSTIFDIDQLVTLSKAKRLSYEKAQPQFWRYAGENGDCGQKNWFTELLNDQNTFMLTAEDEHQQILGFIIGRLLPAPEVYNPGGLTLMIDDFCVQSEKLWEVIGAQLVAAIKVKVKVKGAAQLLVVCGKHDYVKRKFLMDQNLTIASEWFVGSIV